MTTIQPLLTRVLHRLQERLDEALVGVILYGSYAREEASKDSDIDLMVVVRHLPQEWSDIFTLEDELMGVGHDLGSRLDIRLVEPEAVSYSVHWAAPLMLEIYDAHQIVFDPKGFIKDEMRRFEDIIRQRGIHKVSPGVWRVPAVAHS